MGEINIKDRDAILNNSRRELVEMCSSIQNMCERQVALLIIILAQYLYALSCVECKVVDGKYRVFAKDVSKFIKEPWSMYAKEIVLLRNNLCHNYGDGDTMHKLREIYSDLNTLLEFTIYLGLREAVNLSSALDNLANFK